MLSIETATENCSVALRFDGEISQKQQIIPNGHSRLVHGMVEQLLLERKIQLIDLDAIAVDVGPGSFTGLRIGIGIAQGLAFASGLKAVGVHSLEALAAPIENSFVLSAIDARMGQVYWCFYDTRNGTTPLLAAQVSNPNVVLSSIQSILDVGAGGSSDVSVIGVGSGWQVYGDSLPLTIANREVKVINGRYPEARDLLLLANSESLESPMGLNAAYVRNNVAQKIESRRKQ